MTAQAICLQCTCVDCGHLWLAMRPLTFCPDCFSDTWNADAVPSGPTAMLRKVDIGETIVMAAKLGRSNIYNLVKRIGIKVKIAKIADGFKVTRYE